MRIGVVAGIGFSQVDATGGSMKPKSALAIAVITLAGVTTYLVTASGHADEPSAPMYVTKIPSGYRDWRVISVAHEEGSLHSFGIVLGNDVAIKAYRDGKLPFPDGAIIAALHFSHIEGAGGLDTSTRMANPAERRYLRLALRATRWLRVILSSPGTRPDYH
jgi:hypothetical protein